MFSVSCFVLRKGKAEKTNYVVYIINALKSYLAVSNAPSFVLERTSKFQLNFLYNYCIQISASIVNIATYFLTSVFHKGLYFCFVLHFTVTKLPLLNLTQIQSTRNELTNSWISIRTLKLKESMDDSSSYAENHWN